MVATDELGGVAVVLGVVGTVFAAMPEGCCGVTLVLVDGAVVVEEFGVESAGPEFGAAAGGTVLPIAG